MEASAKDPLLFMIDDLDAMAWDVGGRAALTLIQDVIEAVKLRRGGLVGSTVVVGLSFIV